MKYPRVWEDITDDVYAGCSRLKVFGCWLVIAWVNSAKTLPESLVFVPDTEHKWELEPKKKEK